MMSPRHGDLIPIIILHEINGQGAKLTTFGEQQQAVMAVNKGPGQFIIARGPSALLGVPVAAPRELQFRNVPRSRLVQYGKKLRRETKLWLSILTDSCCGERSE